MACYTFMPEDVKGAFSSRSLLLGDDGCMKANRKFIEKEAGVSAVIGVILMVAITVAIAATVYVYVSGMIGGTQEQTPTMACTVSAGDNTVTVASSGTGISWTDVQIKADASIVWLSMNTVTNSTAVNATLQTVGGTVYTGESGDIEAGDVFQIIGPASLSGEVKLTFVYTPTNAILGSWTVNV